MGFSDRLSNLRQLLPGARLPEDDERLLQLYWNRAELKKELVRLQDERHRLLEKLRDRESAVVQAREQVKVLEEYLGNPEISAHALVYFQLRALWRAASAKLAHFAQQLEQQQADREYRRQSIEFDRGRQRRLAVLDGRIHDARSRADRLEQRVQLLESELAALRRFWSYFRRRQIAETLQAERAQWDAAVTETTDLSDDRADLDAAPPPPFSGISIGGRRTVNTAVIAYAQQLVVAFSQGGLAMLAKETTSKKLFDVRYGGHEECAPLIAALREALIALKAENADLGGLKQRIAALRASARYRSDADTVPLTDSIGTLPAPSSVNVLVDDYWEIYRVLLR